MAAGDFNGDGWLDLALSNVRFIGPGGVSVLINNTRTKHGVPDSSRDKALFHRFNPEVLNSHRRVGAVRRKRPGCGAR